MNRWEMLLRAASFDPPGQVIAPVTRDHADAIVIAATAVEEKDLRHVYSNINAFDYIGAGRALKDVADANADTVYGPMLARAVARFEFGTKQALGGEAYAALQLAADDLIFRADDAEVSEQAGLDVAEATIADYRLHSKPLFLNAGGLTKGLAKLELAGGRLKARKEAIDVATLSHVIRHQGDVDILVARTFFDLRQRSMVAVAAEVYVTKLKQKAMDEKSQLLRPTSYVDMYLDKSDMTLKVDPAPSRREAVSATLVSRALSRTSSFAHSLRPRAAPAPTHRS